MLTIEEIDCREAMAGRMLLQLTCQELADMAGVAVISVHNLEGGLTSQGRARAAILRTLHEQGIRFMDRGDVRHLDGRMGITREVFGILHGHRLARGRRMLRLTHERMCSKARIGMRALVRLENARDLQGHPTLGLYRVVSALQLAGYTFGAWHQGKLGDRLVVERPPTVTELQRMERAMRRRLSGQPDLALKAELERELSLLAD